MKHGMSEMMSTGFWIDTLTLLKQTDMAQACRNAKTPRIARFPVSGGILFDTISVDTRHFVQRSKWH